MTIPPDFTTIAHAAYRRLTQLRVSMRTNQMLSDTTPQLLDACCADLVQARHDVDVVLAYVQYLKQGQRNG